jgi:pimeloyl-ACP methyl ester carboxylesterase
VATRPIAPPLDCSANIRLADCDPRQQVLETALRLGGDTAIFAIVTQRASTDVHASIAHGAVAHAPMVVLLNSGSVPHIGPNRVYVTLARLLANRGLIVARIDLPGLGDSPPHAGARENLPYSPTALADIETALLELQRRYGATDLHLCGICSGAYHALKSALADPVVRSAVVINPLTYFWQQGMIVRMPEARVAAEAARYGRTVLQWAAWKKLLGGRVNVMAALRIAGRRIAQLTRSRWRDLARRVHIPLADDLGEVLRRIAGRQVQLRFIFSDSDPGLTMLHEQGGHVVRELLRAQALTIDIIPNTDHTFTNLSGRNAMIAAVLSHFDACGRPAST